MAARTHLETTRSSGLAARSPRALAVACVGLLVVSACASKEESKGAPPTATPSSTSPGTSPSGTPLPDAQPAAQPTSGSGFDLVKDGNTYTATSKDRPQIKIIVDCDDQADDGHYFSIALTIDGRSMDGPLWGNDIGLLLHDDDASYGLTNANKCVSVEVVNGRLQTRFLSGSYKNLLDTGSDDPVPMNADFYLDGSKHLVAELSGLYYVLPTVQNTTVAITTNGAVQTRVFKQPAADTLEYFDNVTFIDVDDALYGHFTIETDLRLLQLQHEVAYSRFELDYDHSFKDRGQASVTSKITFL